MSDPFHTKPRRSRREFFGLAAGGVAAAAGGAALLRDGEEPPTTDQSSPASSSLNRDSVPTTEAPRPLPASTDVEGRTLVVVELQGGNDGLATLVPRNAGTLYDLSLIHISEPTRPY